MVMSEAATVSNCHNVDIKKGEILFGIRMAEQCPRILSLGRAVKVAAASRVMASGCQTLTPGGQGGGPGWAVGGVS